MCLLFTAFSAPTHFLGDGYTVINNLASESGMFHKWSEAGITYFLSFAQSLVGPKNIHTATAAYRIVSILSGAIAIYLFFLISQVLSEQRLIRILSFILMLFSGTMLLFFGYAESYPALWACFPAFVYFSINSLRGRRGKTGAGFFLALGIIFHLQMLVFIPAYVFVIFSSKKGLILYNRLKLFIWIILALMAIAGIITFIYKYRTDLYFENIFLPLLSGKPADPGYAIISPPHLIDILNILILLSPLLFLLFILAAENISAVFRQKHSAFLAILSLSYILYLIVIDPMMSMPRDWDLFSLAAFGPTLFFAALVSEKHIHILERLFPTILVYLIVAVTPYLIVNLKPNTSIDYLKYIIRLDFKKSQSSLVTLRDYYRLNGDAALADSLTNIGQAEFPLTRKIDSVFRALDRNNVELAQTIAKSIRPDKFSSVYHNMLSVLNSRLGKYEEAVEESNKAIQLQKYNHILYCNRALVHFKLEDHESSLKDLRKGYKLNNRYPEIIKALTIIYFRNREIDSAAYYANRLIVLDSSCTDGYYILSHIYSQKQDIDSLRIYSELYRLYGQSDRLYSSRVEELSRLEKALNDDL
jgi:tetratricopeptide (TPR) repeat protein